MLFDMHSHTDHSIDSMASPDVMCRQAYRLGVSVYNISDHCDVNRDFELHCLERSTASINDALRLKAEYSGRMTVLAGIEVGNAHWNPTLARECVSIPGIDCVTGSVHRILYDDTELVTSKADFASMTPELIYELNVKYFEDILLMLDTLEPDILAHPTYMFRYIERCHAHADINDYKPQVDAFLRRIISDGIALELNTSTIVDSVAGYDVYVLERYHALGGRIITMGSDAHSPDRIANGFRIAARELLRTGFDSVCTIEERNIISHKLKEE